MKRTTASLLTGALAAGTFVGLATLVPSAASAAGCGVTEVTNENVAQSGWLIPDTGNSNGTGYSATFQDAGAEEGVKLNPGTGKVTVTYPISAAGVPLAGQTAMSNYAYSYFRDSGAPTAAGAPSYQLTLDTDGNPNNTTGFATLVYEPVYQTEGRQGTWWSTRPNPGTDPSPYIQHAGGHGSDDWGTLDQFSLAYPNAAIQAFGVTQASTNGSPSLLSSVKFGCNTFDFELANRAPEAVINPEDNASDSDYRTFFLSGVGSTDPDGDKLTYSWTVENGTPATSTDAEFKVTFPNGPGEYDVTLTVSDGKLTSTKTSVIKVTPPSNTVRDEKLANTGADVKGLAALGGLVVAGSAAGLVANRRRKGADAA
jgi:hypothetical protein